MVRSINDYERDENMKHEPYWWSIAGEPFAPNFEPVPREADVLIIGAGLTGLSAARTLAKSGRSTLVLDAGAPGIGASSRNGGMVGGGQKMSPENLISQYGLNTATDLMREAHIDSVSFVEDLIASEKIECDFQPSGRFRGFWRSAEYDRAGHELEKMKSLFPVEAELIPRSRQHEEVSSDLYRGGVVYKRHGALNPAKWVKGLLHAATRAGAIVQGNTVVVKLERDKKYIAVTNKGRICAGKVLVATNGYTGSLNPRLRRRIIPVPSFIVSTVPLGKNYVQSLIPNGRMIVESRERHCYYRPSPDGERIVFGGRAAMFNAPNVLTDPDMRRLLAQVFPALKNVELSHSWRGFTGFTFDYLPNVGEIDGIWHAMGYSGSGNAMAPWLGHKAALGIMEAPGAYTAYSKTNFDTRWWHNGSPWFLPFADLTFRFRDIMNSIQRQ